MRAVLARLLRRLARALGVPEIQHTVTLMHGRLDAVEIHSRGVEQISRDAFTSAQFLEERAIQYTDTMVSKIERDLHNQIVSSHDAAVFHVEQRRIQIDQAIDSIRDLVTAVKDEAASSSTESQKKIADIRRIVDLLQREISSTTVDTYSAISAAHDSNGDRPSPISDNLYVSLEDSFRGDPKLVRERQSAYLPYFREIVTSNQPLLDIGCGRGEWLALLRDTGISSKGVDGNRACVAECREQGLDVIHEDLLEHLRGLQDQSLGAVTMFQVMEHLPFSTVVDVLREIRRVLVSDGLLIAEIPNIKNVRVGSGTFWIDPTHQAPLFPDVLEFLAQSVGFSSTNGLYLNPLMPAPDVSSLDEPLRHRLAAVFDALDGPADFALIAQA